MTYVRKTQDTWELQANYGYGWEVETTEESRKAAKEQIKCDLDNVPGINIKIVKRRERIEGVTA